LNVGIINLDFKKGNYKSIVFEFVGVNGTGLTLATTDLGNLILSRDSKDFCNADLQDVINKNNYEHGIDLSTSTVSSSFFFSAAYDFAKPHDKQNIARFEPNNGRIVINLGANCSTIASGQLNVYGVFTKGVEKYLRKWLPFSQNLGSVGTQLAIPLRQSNVNSLYFRTGTDFQTINVLKDDYPVLFASGKSLVADTMYYGNIENTIAFIYEDLNLTDDPAEITSDALQLNLTSNTSGGVSVIMYEVIEFDVSKTAVSVASYQKFASSKLQKNTPATQVTAVLTGITPASTAVAAAGASGQWNPVTHKYESK
jgi:hypothetical protein